MRVLRPVGFGPCPCGAPGRRCSRRLLVLTIGVLLAPLAHAGEGGSRRGEAWWQQPRRMIQTNLREIDATMDLDAYVAAIEDCKADVVLFNVGGIVANYETSLPFHYRNPFMKGDLAVEVARRLHEKGIRMIGRFDFSKVNEAIARDHPDWLARDREGQPFPPYNGQVPTCLNGGYQQEAMFQILSEAIAHVPLDGVFFNMIGYPRSDYSGRALGICQCAGCRTRFRAMYNEELPQREQAGDVTYEHYEAFCQRTIADQFERVQRLIKRANPDLAICTYTAAGVDVIRAESNTPQGRFTYEDSEKARRILLENPDRMLSNAAVHFFHYPHRFTSVAPGLTQRRLLQQMLNGGWLDFYCIGPLHAQEDRLGLDEVRAVFRFHAANERWLLDTTELADVGLAMDAARGSDELLGLLRIMASSSVSVDLVDLERTDLDEYPALVVPVTGRLTPQAIARLDAYVEKGGRLLLTGDAPAALRCLGRQSEDEPLPRADGTYVRIRPADRVRLGDGETLGKLDLVYLDGPLARGSMADDVEGLLRYIPPAMFGPPEKCYYTEVSDVACLYARQAGQGRVAWFPWQVGSHYEAQRHAGHHALVMGAIEGLLKLDRALQTDAPPCVELNHRGAPAGGFEWVSLINHSGQLDGVVGEPLPIHDIAITLRPRAAVRTARMLSTGQELPIQRRDDGSCVCTLPRLDAFEVVLFEP